ncbi:MAG: hypothetical protein GQ574_17040 [Crocinitomix sp.]|nr:hypothetical protein [Crocinitomix sp.]
MSNFKFIVLFILTAVLSTDTYTQYVFGNYNLHDQQYQLVYAGCKNEIIISGLSEVKHAYLTSSGSTVTQLNDSTYILKPRYRLHMDTLRLFINDELVQKELFMVMHPPTVKVQLGEIETTAVAIKTILKNAYLNLIIDGFYKDYEVLTAFKLNILDQNGVIIKTFEPNVNTRLTKEQIEFIKTLKSGNQLEFSQIIVSSAQGMKRKKPVYVLTIK